MSALPNTLRAASLPSRFRLIEILIALPGTPMPEVHRPPQGKCLVCGYGHFGQAVAKYLSLPGVDLTIVDPDGDGPADARVVLGTGTDANVLIEAGIKKQAASSQAATTM